MPIKIKQFWATEYKGTTILQALTENGELYVYEKDLETKEEKWTKIIVPLEEVK